MCLVKTRYHKSTRVTSLTAPSSNSSEKGVHSQRKDEQNQQRYEELARSSLQVRHEVDHDIENENLYSNKWQVYNDLSDGECRRPIKRETLVLQKDRSRSKDSLKIMSASPCLSL